jgi:hypothetical protein
MKIHENIHGIVKMEKLHQHLVMHKIYGVEMEQCNLHMRHVILKIQDPLV